MPTYRDFIHAFRDLGLGANSRVIAHASLSAFDRVQGGTQAMLGAMLASFESLMMPAFTYKTMITPALGPSDNGIVYGAGEDQNRMAEFYRPEMRVDPVIGDLAETLRLHPQAERSFHPILSFSGIDLKETLEAQSLEEPLAPIGWLAEQDGDVLLMGVNHTVNTSLHYAERLAGRKQFVRWALTPSGVVACPGWPGCSRGFEAIRPRLRGVARWARVGPARVESIPLRDLIHITTGWIREDPRALLCDRPDCARCQAVRAGLRVTPG